jgi:hypothetical protein
MAETPLLLLARLMNFKNFKDFTNPLFPMYDTRRLC